MRMRYFWAQNGPFAQTIIFLEKKLLILFSFTYWRLSLSKIFKKILTADPEFWGPKWPICPNEDFLKKPVHKPCFHLCLCTCQKSKPDINLLMKY